MAVGLRRGAREWERIAALAAFGALLYVPYVLRSPEHPIFGEELLQLQSVRAARGDGSYPARLSRPRLRRALAARRHGHRRRSSRASCRSPSTRRAAARVRDRAHARAGRPHQLPGRPDLSRQSRVLLPPFRVRPGDARDTALPGRLGGVVACAADRSAAALYVPAIVVLIAGAVVTDHLSALMIAVWLRRARRVTAGQAQGRAGTRSRWPPGASSCSTSGCWSTRPRPAST